MPDHIIANRGFEAWFDSQGCLRSLIARSDDRRTNWVVDTDYLTAAGYDGAGKSFGDLDIAVHGNETATWKRSLVRAETSHTVHWMSPQLRAQVAFDFAVDSNDVQFSIDVENITTEPVTLDQLAVWTPFADVMYRDIDVQRNIQDSVAVFPSISPSYTRLAMHRRSGQAPHLALLQSGGARTESVGTWCAWSNRFFEDASPSLDGVLFHQLVLAGGYPDGAEPAADWVYRRNSFTLSPGERSTWRYRLTTYADVDDFLHQAKRRGHPVIDVPPMGIVGESVSIRVTPPTGRTLTKITIRSAEGTTINERPVPFDSTVTSESHLPAACHVEASDPGEHQLLFKFDDGTVDQVITNIMRPVATVLQSRAQHIAEVLYDGAEGTTPFAFQPISNQGESLGKLTFLLAQNLLDDIDVEQVRKVECSAVDYVRPKWFVDGDLRTPRRLYGNFYRVMDFEYIAHLFFLLSRFSDAVLSKNTGRTYLDWAAQVFVLRVDPSRHEDARGKEESSMLGVHFLYAEELLTTVESELPMSQHADHRRAWERTLDTVAAHSHSYSGAVTEHFYDNAGFGPTAGALCRSGRTDAGGRYAELLAANIGFSNDFRAQSPDRWWEALSPMIHALWGGVAAAAMLSVYEAIPDSRYLLAAHRATVAMLYCYDFDATATTLKLAPGEAASTYSISGPNLNRPDLSRNRFGQSTFACDGGIFARLFPDGASSPDWDMGEELVAYLQGFGRKTFLYETPDGEIRVVNGSITRTASGLRIASHAPHPVEYHFYDRGLHLTLDEPSAFIHFDADGFHLTSNTTGA